MRRSLLTLRPSLHCIGMGQHISLQLVPKSGFIGPGDNYENYRKIGISSDNLCRNETGPLVQRISANIHKRYASWKEAFEVYKRCYEANFVHIIDCNITSVSYNLPVAM